MTTVNLSMPPPAEKFPGKRGRRMPAPVKVKE
jgi:hypothetical protein